MTTGTIDLCCNHTVDIFKKKLICDIFFITGRHLQAVKFQPIIFHPIFYSIWGGGQKKSTG